MKTGEQILCEVAEVYKWLDLQIEQSNQSAPCDACGRCCDFEKFDHRLFVTSPEFLYLFSKIAPKSIRTMPAGICPYNESGKCSVYENRFAGCRIFSCRGDKDLQSQLSELALKKFKSICEKYQIDYRYTDLAKGLNEFSS